MRASIKARTLGRSRFLFEDYLKESNVNKLKYKIEKLKGVKTCEISPISKSIIVNYDEDYIGNIARFILDFDLKSLDNFEIDDADFIPQVDKSIFHILRNAAYKRIIFGKIMPMPLRPFFTILRAYPFVKEGLKSIKNRKLDVALLDASAISVSIVTGQFADAASIMALLSLGEELEDYTLKKSRLNLKSSLALNVDQVLVKDGDKKVFKHLKEVEVGDLIYVSMGTTIPVDGEVVEGFGMVNESSFTGEAKAVEKNEKSSVFAGTVLEEGDLLVRAKKKYDDSRLNHIIKLIEDSEKNKSLAQIKAESMADSLVKYSFIGAGLTYLLTRNFIKAKSFLMVDYSCALKLTIPIAYMKAISQAGDENMLVKGGKYFESIAKADTIIFDKTGTLTKSEPEVKRVIAFDIDEDEALRIAACLEEHFPHSIARAVVKKAKEKNLNHEEMHSKPEYVMAHGIKSTIDGKPALIGSEHFILEDEKIKISSEQGDLINSLKEEYSLLFMAYDNKLMSVLCIDDPIRKDAKETISNLRKLGFTHIAMLTGDNENSARAVSKKLDLDFYKSQVLPEDKEEYIKKMKDMGKKVIMIGDGVNDSIALSQADVGISMSKGADLAKEISDVSIKTDSLKELVDLVKLSRSVDKRVRNDYEKIIAFNTLLIALGLGSFITNTQSALLHNISTVAIASDNMKKYKF
ncbi:MAG: heavy metal translocating P-type ATPase [Anaerococcus vaginalis]|uniref:heavy metal translocating P-type ATPase n=2 Tax=Anaerococcus vaginalis TaxID=33037 RepID=UPI00290E047A|nr:heavy metal translocating P-type ATPase [Anaerococcus vaginalis]MDU6181661.1 heavy metal translocating P-type ATPase [Anaerococcus vaginalis]MDU7433213.1 heavy metal translocating P-type ATPase [Anaerococcus vaginalis]